MIVKDDIQTIEEVFKMLDKVKFNDVTPSEVIKFAATMRKLAQLQNKMESGLSKLEEKVVEEEPKQNKRTKKASKLCL